MFALKESYYSWKMGLRLRNGHQKKYCPQLDNLVKKIIDDGIITYNKINPYEAIVVTQGGIIMRFWNANRFYCWLSQGAIFDKLKILKDEDLNSFGSRFIWDDKRPSIESLYKLRKEIEKLENGEPEIG